MTLLLNLAARAVVQGIAIEIGSHIGKQLIKQYKMRNLNLQPLKEVAEKLQMNLKNFTPMQIKQMVENIKKYDNEKT